MSTPQPEHRAVNGEGYNTPTVSLRPISCRFHPTPDRLVPSFSMFETIYLSMDANFKLKQKERGFSDPPLANGFAYMVSNERLLKHLRECAGSKVLSDEVISTRDTFSFSPNFVW